MIQNLILAVLVFFLGASVASFLNVIVYRTEEGFEIKALLFESSHCEHCKKKLTWYELFPVFGWFFIGGKCPKCKEKVSFLYPLSEFLLGISFALVFYLDYSYLYYLIFSMLFCLAMFDIIAHRLIPKGILNTFLVIGCIIYFYRYFSGDISAIPLIEAALLSLMLFCINILKKSFGFGDILVIFLMSFFAQEYNVTKAFFIAAILGAIVGLFLIAKDKSWRKRYIPFIPFLAMGFVIATLWHIQLVLT